MVSASDKKLLNLLSKGLGGGLRPFKSIAGKLNISEELLLEKIKDYKRQGVIRKFSGVVNHRKAGYFFNGMVVWQVPKKDIEKIGSLFASFKEVTHCYQRKSYPQWPYNFYTMVHSKTKSGCEKIVKSLARKSGIKDYKVLYSTKELKKSPFILC